ARGAPCDRAPERAPLPPQISLGTHHPPPPLPRRWPWGPPLAPACRPFGRAPPRQQPPHHVVGPAEPLPADFGRQLLCVVAALLPALPQVGGEAIHAPRHAAGSTLRESIGLHVTAHSAAVQVQLIGNGSLRQALPV